MRTFKIALVVMILAATAASQNSEQQPASFDQVVERFLAQENALVINLRAYNPLVETYVQELTPDPELGLTPKNDVYFLSKAELSSGIGDLSFSRQQGKRSRMLGRVTKLLAPGMQYNGSGFLQGMVVDATALDREHYTFEYVRREFLGEVRCLVFDVLPKNLKESGRFQGRIWVEDQDYNVVRLSGVRVKAAKFAHYFHFDSWRTNMGPGLWLPTYIYSEDTDVKYGLVRTARMKAQTRLWGYDLQRLNKQDELSTILVESHTEVTDHSETAPDKSPIQAVRAWERQAEENVLEKLQKAGLLAPAGEVEKVLDTVVTNLIVTNNLDIQPEVRCRVLLTSPLESFSVGHTIVLSRGLIDTLPDEASLAMVLSHELAHVTLGHRSSTKYAFHDRIMFGDEQTFQRMRFQYSQPEEQAADSKALELLKNSPYKDKLSEGGLFLRALAARAKVMPNLVSAHMGNRLAMGEQVLRLPEVVNSAPALEMNKPDQIAALPLGARLKVDPWSNRVEMLRSKPQAGLAARDKLPFEVTPFMPHLTRKGEAVAPTGGPQVSQSENPQISAH